MSDETSSTIITDDLGFPLTVTIVVGSCEKLGAHHCYENLETGLVDAGDPHKIKVQHGLDASTACMVAAHEAFHLFKSIRHLVKADEEVEAGTFGELVRQVFDASQRGKTR